MDVLFGSATSTSLKRLDILQHQALRTCTSAFKTIPAAALQVEMAEILLELWRLRLSLSYWGSLQGHKQADSTDIIKPCWEKEVAKIFWMDSSKESNRTKSTSIKFQSNSTITSNTTLDTSRCNSRFDIVGKEHGQNVFLILLLHSHISTVTIVMFKST